MPTKTTTQPRITGHRRPVGAGAAGAAGRATVGERLVQGLTQVRDALRSGAPLSGQFTVRTIEIPDPPHYRPTDVRRVRQSLMVSQALFARVVGASPILVRSWESGKRVPSAMARRLLDLIERRPEDVVPFLKGARTATARHGLRGGMDQSHERSPARA